MPHGRPNPRITFQYWETITFKASAIIFNRFFWMTYLQDISNLYPEILATFCSEIIWATEHLVNVLSAVSCICWKHNWKIEDCVFFTRL